MKHRDWYDVKLNEVNSKKLNIDKNVIEKLLGYTHFI